MKYEKQGCRYFLKKHFKNNTILRKISKIVFRAQQISKVTKIIKIMIKYFNLQILNIEK